MFERFSYRTIDEIEKQIRDLNVDVDLNDDLSIYKSHIKIGNKEIQNRLAVHPMEGADGELNGVPGTLTIRRYERFVKGGAGLIWFEAVSVVPEGRANPRQLWINEDNWESFKLLRKSIDKWAKEEFGEGFSPLVIMQLTHSGRFSTPIDKSKPVIAVHNPYLNQKMELNDDYPVITDEELANLEKDFEKAAILAERAGFDGVDIKACHRYLISELLSAYERSGIYGGDLEGRSRFLLNVIDRVKKNTGEDFIVASRLNMYDGIPRPYGWGVNKDDYTKTDFSEPLELAARMREKGVSLINITMGTPYYNPHVNRPYDSGGYIPTEHPLEGVSRLLSGAGAIQKRWNDLTVIATGFSWLREFAPYVGAWVLQKGMASMVGMGREGFAYPDFAKDILSRNGMDREKCCITCGKCAELLRAHSYTGCVIRDTKIYAELYKNSSGL